MACNNESNFNFIKFIGKQQLCLNTDQAELFAQIITACNSFDSFTLSDGGILQACFTLDGEAVCKSVDFTDLIGGGGGGEDTDELVKISSNDTTSDYLVEKLIGSDNIILTENNDGGNETLTISFQDSQSSLVFGGVVTWLGGYTFHVTAAGYYINGQFYTSPETIITLSPADPLLDRFDVIYVDTTGTVQVLEGTPSQLPLQPGLDLGLELGLAAVLVEAGSTEPVDVEQECIYLENGEWSTSTSDGSINPSSATTPCLGAVGVEASASGNGDSLVLTRSLPFAPMATFNVITFQLKPKSDWDTDNTVHSLKIRFRLAGTQVGNEITIGNGLQGFDVTNFDCQIISLPTSVFSIAESSEVDELEISVFSSSGTFGWFLDGLCLQGGIFAPNEGNFIWNQFTGPQSNSAASWWIRNHGRADGWLTSPQRIGTTEDFYSGSEKFGLFSVAHSRGTAVGYAATTSEQGVTVGALSLGTVFGDVVVGQESSAAGGVAVGWHTHAGSQSVSLGHAANTGGSVNATAVGWGTIADNLSIALGWSSAAIHTTSLVIGYGAFSTADRQTVIGGSHNFAGYDDFYFGYGVNKSNDSGSNGLPGILNFHQSGAEGTDKDGGTWRDVLSFGTGTGLAGTREWWVADPTSSGTTLHSSPSLRMALNVNTKGLYLDNIRFQTDEGADIIAANDLTLGIGNAFTITGSAQINAITSTNWQEGVTITLHLVGNPTLKHNTVGGAGTAPLRLTGAVDFVISGYTVLQLQYKDGFWNEIGRADEAGSGSGTLTDANNGTSLSGTIVQLGQAIGAVGNPGILLSNREIPMANFTLNFNADVAQSNNITVWKNSAAAIRARVTAAADFSNTGGQSGAEKFGDGASVTGANGIAVGNAATASTGITIGTGSSSGATSVLIGNATNTSAFTNTVAIAGTVTGNSGVAVGSSSSASASAVALGASALASASGAVALGTNAQATGQNALGINGVALHVTSVAIGGTTTATNQIVMGAETNAFADMYLGGGVQSTTANLGSMTIHTSGGQGTNVGGSTLILAGGKGTGNAPGGPVIIQTSDPLGSGSTLQSLTPKFEVHVDGEIQANEYGSATFVGTPTTYAAWDASGNFIEVDLTDIGTAPVITANNGLSKNIPTNVQLGGPVGTPAPLVMDTYIDATANYDINISGSKLGSNGIFNVTQSALNSAAISGTSSNGQAAKGIYGKTTSGVGVWGEAIGGFCGGLFTNTTGVGLNTQTSGVGAGVPLEVITSSNITNATHNMIRLRRSTSGTATTGFGSHILFDASSATIGDRNQASIGVAWTDATDATRSAEMKISVADNAVLNDCLVIGGQGFIKFRSITATQASAITAADGMLVYVNNTDATFTSVGFWGYENGTWIKL